MKPLRLAFLADAETRPLAKAIQKLGFSHAFEIETFCAPPGTLETEAFDLNSAFHDFQPDVVFLLPATQDVIERLRTAPDKTRFAEREADRFQKIRAFLSETTQAKIVQANLPAPLLRVYGHNESRIKASTSSLLAEINERLAASVAQTGTASLFDCAHCAATFGLAAWYDPRLWFMAKVFCAEGALPLLAESALALLRALRGASIKLIAVDLDNTLWGGEVAEGGAENLRLGAFDDGAAFVAFQHFLADLKRRGFLLAVVSKNDPNQAREPFRTRAEMILREDDFVAFEAGWDPKPEALKRIVAKLRIGLDAVLFLDDSAFERAAVRALLPEVVVPEVPEDPAFVLHALAQLPLFELAAEGEDRTAFFAAETKRAQEQARFEDYRAFLASLNMKASLGAPEENAFSRLAELSARSNQANLSTQRFDAAAYRRFAQDPSCRLLVLTLSDAFGSYGLVGILLLRTTPEALRIEDFILSCRVLGRTVEAFLFNALLDEAARLHRHTLEARFVPTEKNGRMKEMLSAFGFAPSTQDGATLWVLQTQSATPLETFVGTAS